MYVAPQESEFGTYPPSAEKVVSSYGKITGERIVPSGARAANNLGLTTQVPVEELFLTSGKARTLMARTAEGLPETCPFLADGNAELQGR
jgi:hypothetical protein